MRLTVPFIVAACRHRDLHSTPTPSKVRQALRLRGGLQGLDVVNAWPPAGDSSVSQDVLDKGGRSCRTECPPRHTGQGRRFGRFMDIAAHRAAGSKEGGGGV